MDPDFVVPQLHQFISHANWFKTCYRASARTSDDAILFEITGGVIWSPVKLSVEIKCRELDRQLSSLARVCSSSFLLLSTLVELDIVEFLPLNSQSHWKDDIESTKWLELLHPFTAVQDLSLSYQVGRHVCQALEALAEESVTEVLPALQNIFLSDSQPL
ncbi:hypothetical protein F5148DRAFT_1201507, partial [Russula earlei]